VSSIHQTSLQSSLTNNGFSSQSLFWAIGSLCAAHRLPFSAQLLEREFPPPHDEFSIIRAARTMGMQITPLPWSEQPVEALALPLLVLVDGAPGIMTHWETDAGGLTHALVYLDGAATAQKISIEQLKKRADPIAYQTKPMAPAIQDPDTQATQTAKTFGFRWFWPELLRYKKVWRDVLLGSAVLQIIALATPLFTQAIIDKVVVHRTQSTLIAIGVAMLIFTLFTALLSWVRQYLVLHTGNRVDAVLGAAVWEHLLRLPLPYFHHRPTGVVAARLHGVETIREFVSGAAVTLVLDLPFLLICLGVMLYYHLALSALVVAILLLIAVVSYFMAPVFQQRLNEQFLMGARNQAFVTEHIAGFETVKSLQMEPLLRKRYGQYLSSYLQSGFDTRQVANTYNIFSTTAEQIMTLAILIVGAWVVMNDPTFTIGMLVAFQMFASKLSQPVLRIVGLWTQFQQASLAVQRLGDVMNVRPESYSVAPRRQSAGQGRLELQALGFRYADSSPLLFSGLNLTVEPGQAIAVMGPSGSGKSTLAKLLLGFYTPSQGQIRIDNIDITHLCANELRNYFGVVPQETILFSGTILDNLLAGNPAASFEQVIVACKLAGIHDTIEAQAEGYATTIGERGAGLSGGQKQRLAIARALLKRPKILIFDEATSALDKDTAEAFASTVNQLKGKVTMLFITHGLPRNLKVDGVLEMSQTRLNELKAGN
jgi:ATP-binding cassette, subfamily B, bacterial HlyB/CyaB